MVAPRSALHAKKLGFEKVARIFREEVGRRGYKTLREFAVRTGLGDRMSYEVVRQVVNAAKPCRETTIMAIADALRMGRRETTQLLDLAGFPEVAGLVRKRPPADEPLMSAGGAAEREIVDIFRSLDAEAQACVVSLLHVLARPR